MKSDDISKDDLRFRVKGKYALDVIKWFESRKDRETTYDREFNEELIEDHGFDKDIFYPNHSERCKNNESIWLQYFSSML